MFKKNEEIKKTAADIQQVKNGLDSFIRLCLGKAAEAEGVERLRLLRDESLISSEGNGKDNLNGAADIWFAEDAEDAARIAAQMRGRVLLTTGSKDLGIYGGILDPEQHQSSPR